MRKPACLFEYGADKIRVSAYEIGDGYGFFAFKLDLIEKDDAASGFNADSIADFKNLPELMPRLRTLFLE